jgi:HK97 family phage major capsid protein/HK97 family phage prohead protease
MAPLINRAYSLLQIKSIDEESRVITGIATTPTPDRMGDIVDAAGAEFQLPIPLLWQHNSREPVGEVFAATVTADGIAISARFAKIDEPGKLKDRLDEAWQSVKAKLVRGLSIGFSEIESARIKDTWSFHYLKWLWLELSAVTIPANAEATIQTIKSFDVGLAAPGTKAVVVPKTTSGVSDTTRVVKARSEIRTMKKTYAEQITSFEATRQAKSAEIDTIIETASDANVTLDAAQKETHDTLVGEVKEIDEHLVRLRGAEERNKQAAKPVAGETPEKAAASRGGQVLVIERKLPPGIGFARFAMIQAIAKGSRSDAMAIALECYPDDKALQAVIKTAVGGATTANAQGPLLQYTDYFQDFVEYLRPKTIIGQFGQNGIPAMRAVPFNIRVNVQSAGGTGYWVGQGKPVPLTKGTFTTTTLDFTRVGAISVLTKEEVRFASPSAEAKVRDDLAASLIARMDQDFVDPANAGTASVKPASITNGIAASAVSGTNAAAVRTDFKTLLAGFIAANIEPTSGVLIMSSTIALSLSLMMNALGQPEFAGLTMKGGTLLGFPVIVSEYLTALGSPSTQMIVAANASDIYLADDGGVSVESSDQASLEMLDGTLLQDGTAGTGASLVSLWQTGMLGLKAEREITWKLRRAAAVQYLSGVAYA